MSRCPLSWGNSVNLANEEVSCLDLWSQCRMGAGMDGMGFSGISCCHHHKEIGVWFPGKVQHVELLFIVCVCGIEPRALCMLSKPFTAELDRYLLGIYSWSFVAGQAPRTGQERHYVLSALGSYHIVLQELLSKSILSLREYLPLWPTEAVLCNEALVSCAGLEPQCVWPSLWGQRS